MSYILICNVLIFLFEPEMEICYKCEQHTTLILLRVSYIYIVIWERLNKI